jgi:predicted dienelactone hydrolase
MKKSIGIGCAILLSLAAFSVAWARSKTGNLKPVGIKLYHFEVQGRTAPVAVWYPAARALDQPFAYNNQAKGTAYLDVEPEQKGAPYPLIVFSHGMGGCGYQSLYFVENLARAGYVVASMDHKDAAMCVMEGKPRITAGRIVGATLKSGGELNSTVMLLFRDAISDFDFSYRPRDISALIDFVLKLNQTDPALKGLVNPQKIGASGHSLGGLTTFLVAGAEYDCLDPQKWPEETCKQQDEMLAHRDKLKPGDFNIADAGKISCCAAGLKGKKTGFKDPRVSAALALGPALLLPEGAFQEFKMPVMVITGSGDFEVPFEPIQKAYDELSPPKYLLHLKGVDHMTITDVAYKMWYTRLFLPGFRSRFSMKKAIYQEFSANFFNAYLKGDQAGVEYINQKHYPLVELQAQK